MDRKLFPSISRLNAGHDQVKMKISRKLVIGFVGIALLSGIMGAFVIFQNSRLREIAEYRIYDSVFLLQSAWRMMEMFEHQEIAAKHCLFFETGNNEYLKAKERSGKAYRNLDEYIQKQPVEVKEYMTSLAEKLYANLQKYQMGIEDAFNLSDHGAEKTLITRKDKEADRFLEIAHEEAMVPMIEYVTEKRVKPAMTKIVQQINITTAVITVISFIALFFAIGVGLFISRIVYLPLTRLEKAASEIGRGNLDAKIDFAFKNDEIGKLAETFKLMSENLKETMVSRDYMNNVFDSAGDAMRIVDLDFNVVAVNNAMAELLGVPRKCSGTQKCYNQFFGNICHTKLCTIERILKGEKKVELEIEKEVKISNVKRKGYFHLTATPLIEHGKITGVVESFQDISLRKKAEIESEEGRLKLKSMLDDLKKSHESLKDAQSQLVQSEKLASIGQLAAGIAHEINNPIGFIKSNLNTFEEYKNKLFEIAGKTESDFMVKDINNLIGETKDGVDRISKIVKDLKSFSRRDEGVMTPSDLNEIVEGILGVVWNEIKYKAELKKDYGKIPLVNCSAQQMGQVFVNLILNAAQAIEEKGTITLRTCLREKQVCVEISDTGGGIRQEYLTKIFDPFFTTKEKDKGTGLGLSISYDIVRKHNGKIDVESEIGKGAKFTVCLPV
ncbi:MAG: ATP-binding protein [Candidatus Omnitrophota bacterium]